MWYSKESSAQDVKNIGVILNEEKMKNIEKLPFTMIVKIAEEKKKRNYLVSEILFYASMK